MVRIINAFREDRPVGRVLASLGDALFGDQATGEINRQQAYALQRGNVETDNLMALAREGGLETLTPAGQAMLIGSGYDPNDLGRIGAMGASTQFGARDPRTTNWSAGIGEYGTTAEAFDADQANQRGMNDADNAAAMARQAALPQAALVNGQPGFVPQGGAFDPGIAPIMTQSEVQGFNLANLFPTLTPEQQLTAVDAAPSLDQVRAGVATDALANGAGLGALPGPEQAFIGADAGTAGGTVKNYIGPDGSRHLVTDESARLMQDVQGNPIPAGGQIVSTALQGGAADIGLTNAAQTDAQSDVVAATKFNAIVDMALPLTENGTLFGPVGWIRSKGQELLQSVQALVDVVDPGATVVNAETGEAAGTLAQFIPEMFDPQLSEVETLWGALLYQGASALAGQQGRSVSDADVRFMRTILGNPMGLFSSAASMRAKLEQARAVVNALSNVSRDVLENGVNTTPATVAPPPAPVATPTVAPPTTGNIAPNPDGTYTWTP